MHIKLLTIYDWIEKQMYTCINMHMHIHINYSVMTNIAFGFIFQVHMFVQSTKTYVS